MAFTADDLRDELAEAAWRAQHPIRVEPGKLAQIATEGERVLLEAGIPFYSHGEALKRPVVDEVEATKGRKAKIARFALVTPDMLRDYLSRCAHWERFNERKKDFVATDPPRDVAATILSRTGEWQFPHTVGVITTPTLRPDGTILSKPGYDPITRLVLMSPPELPFIPERPTRDMATAALKLLDALLEEFPFVDKASRSVALSELITPVVRGAMTVAPLHANRAPTPGTGKSYILDIASAIVTGQPCPVISAGADEFETEKRLAAALLRGQALIAIDNLNGELRGDALCQIIERPIVDVRPLGVSRLVRVESRTTVFANGNNLIMVGDLIRRVLQCSLDANVERPELRQFKNNPLEAVLANRGRYIAAALTIVRAYLAAGCPGSLPVLASFDDWSRLVRSPLVWLGRADPVDTMETARHEDPELDVLRRVVNAWHSVVGTDRPHTAGKLQEIAEQKTTTGDYHDYGGNSFAHPELREAFMSVAYRKGGISSRALGRWLSRHRGRIVSQCKIVGCQDTDAKQHVWMLTQPTHEQ
jgi:putative DNA primase/helicase